MEKQILLIGLILLVILISGCTGLGSTSLKELSTEPEKYLDKEVTITGKIELYVSDTGYAIQDDEGYFMVVEIPKNRLFERGKTYTVDGIVRYRADNHFEKWVIEII
jgi:starvation-inducible outer membrane lipoprotein